MSQDHSISEDFRLRKAIGGFFLLLSLPCLALAVFALTHGGLGWLSLTILAGGLVFLWLGILGLIAGRAPQTRIRVTAAGIWLLPDKSDWFPLRGAVAEGVTIPFDDLTGIDDGGVMFSYRRLQLVTQTGAYRINTTHLDQPLRAIVEAIGAALAERGQTLTEAGIGMRARSGQWRVQP